MPKTGGKAAHTASSDIPRIIPCNRGANAYVLTLDGRTNNHATASDEFLDALISLDMNERIANELTALAEAHPGCGWDKVAGRLANRIASSVPDAELATV